MKGSEQIPKKTAAICRMEPSHSVADLRRGCIVNKMGKFSPNIAEMVYHYMNCLVLREHGCGARSKNGLLTS